MDIAEKILQSKQDFDDVYEAGQKSEYDRFWDAYQENGNRVNYMGAFSGTCWTQEILKPKYKIAPTDGTSTTLRNGAEMFYRCNRSGITRLDFSQIADKFDFSKCVNLSNLFNSSSVDNIYVDASSAENMSAAFSRGDSGLGAISITLKISEKLTKISNMFGYNDQLETLIFTDDSVIATSGLDLHWSTKLSKASILSIFNALSTTATGKSLKISLTAVNNAFETSEGLADGSTSDEWTTLIASRSNWTVALSDT